MYEGGFKFHCTLSSYINSRTDSPHILPILFSFSTPAKFCFRAMANFTKFVTNMPLVSAQTLARKGSTDAVSRKPITRRQSLFAGFKQSLGTRQNSTTNAPDPSSGAVSPTSPMFMQELTHTPPEITLTESPGYTEHQHEKPDSPPLRCPQPQAPPPVRRSISASLTRPSSFLRRSPSAMSPSSSVHQALHEDEPTNFFQGAKSMPTSPATATDAPPKPSVSSSDVGGPRFQLESPVDEQSAEERYAGEVGVYDNFPVCLPGDPHNALIAY